MDFQHRTVVASDGVVTADGLAVDWVFMMRMMRMIMMRMMKRMRMMRMMMIVSMLEMMMGWDY